MREFRGSCVSCSEGLVRVGEDQGSRLGGAGGGLKGFEGIIIAGLLRTVSIRGNIPKYRWLKGHLNAHSDVFF